MLHKRLWGFISLFALLLVVSLPVQARPTLLSAQPDACASEQLPYAPIAQRYERGLIFRIEKCGHGGSYILGTMHSDSPKLMTIYNDAISLIRAMRMVGFEFVEDEKTSAVAAQYMYLPSVQPQGLSNLMPAESFDELARVLQKRLDMPRKLVERLRPWAAAIMLQYPAPVADGVVLDKRLQNYGRAFNKPMFSLETPAEQFEIFHAIPLEKQLLMLRDSIRDLDKLDAANEEFMQAYIARDLRQLDRLAEQSFATTTDAELRDYIRNALLIRRNGVMTERLLPYLRKGDVLVAVGALHLMGEQGILAQLEQQGWHIQPVR
jgi:uncharacterized protein